MAAARSRTYYELFGVSPDCSFAELRSAYRRLARERHPDVSTPVPGLGTMAEINEAWRILGNPERRADYDRTIAVNGPVSGAVNGDVAGAAPRTGSSSSGREAPAWARAATSPGGSRSTMSRRQAWAAGVQAQIARLSRLAGRSATQTLLIRQPRGPRADYEEVVETLIRKLAAEVEPRVRAARAAGAAPLDLGVAATLVGIRSVADGVRRDATLGVTTELLIEAELLDRMWDILAHELPVQLTDSLGGNPRVARVVVPRAGR